MSDFDPKEYWEKRLSESYDLEGVGCVGFSLAYNEWLYKIRKRVFLKTIRKLPIQISDCRILDIGSGTGFYLHQWLKHKPFYLAGSDITSVACGKLKMKYPQMSIYQIDISAKDYQNPESKPFDIISAYDVLFHIVDDEAYNRAFENIRRSLSDDGFLIFSENFLHGSDIRHEHFVARNINKIEKALKLSGFEIKSRYPMFKIMNAPLDNPSGFQKFFWRRIQKWTSRSEMLGNFIGSVLYPLEVILVSVSKESVSTEVMIAQKK